MNDVATPKLKEIEQSDRNQKEQLADNVLRYYRELGNGDERKGVRIAKDNAVKRLIELILNSDKADAELKERAFYTKASLDFLDRFDELTVTPSPCKPK